MVVGSLLLAAGCASSGQRSGDPTGAITGAELVATGHRDLHEALRALRPNWLRARGPGRLSGEVAEVTVFLNETPYGTVRDLSRIPLNAVRDVRYMSPSDATTRYGLSGGSAGLVLVRTGG